MFAVASFFDTEAGGRASVDDLHVCEPPYEAEGVVTLRPRKNLPLTRS